MSADQSQSNQDSRGDKEQQGHGESGVQSQQNAGPEQEQAQKSGNHLGNDHEEKPGPAGGYDATQIQHAPPGYDVRITFNRATALPISDLHTMNSDPYINAEIKTDLPSRHKEDPTLKFRSHTVFNSTEPVWDAVWQLAHVPASGFYLKARIYDEDANDRDDRLGNVHIHVGPINDNWEDIKNKGYKIKKRSGSKRAYMLRAAAVAMRQKKEMSGELFVTIEVLGRSKGEEGGRCYTTGPNYWYKHYSLLLGRIANSRAPDEDTDSDEPSEETQDGQAPDGEIAGNKKLSVENPDKRRGSANSKSSQRSGKSNGKAKSGKYQFQANQFQLKGPVPAELYHRYVDFKPIISNLFTSKGIRGFLLHHALHHQHGMVYNFSTTTKHGVFDHPSFDMTREFLDMVHHDEGGRIHTYVITLDGLMRFTETGKEFGIDFLSKHTMHSDASIYIAYSGEFFIRRLKHPHQQPPEQAQAAASHGASMSNPNDQSNSENGTDNNQHGSLPSHSRAASQTENDTHPPASLSGGPPKEPPPHDPRYYELIIDNDSGTYRPNAKLLPVLASFLSSNFPGLKITTLDCQADEKLMTKLKDQQRERKKAEGNNVIMTQMPRGKHMNSRHRGKGPEEEEGGSSGSSLSSSDEERLANELDDGEEGDGHEPHKIAAAAAPFAGNVVVKEGLKGNLGWQRKLRGLGHKE